MEEVQPGLYWVKLLRAVDIILKYGKSSARIMAPVELPTLRMAGQSAHWTLSYSSAFN